MSYAPQELLQLREYLHSRTGLPYGALGIVGDSGHTYGYHLGKDRLPANDYSTRMIRDKAGLTNAASAIDIGDFSQLRALTAWMVAEAKAGRRPDTREIIGPGAAGRAYRWAFENNWGATIRPSGDSHEFHVHESFFRDSENDDKIQYFRGFFEEDDVADVYYKVNSSDTAYNGHKYVSNRIHRRRLRNPGGIQTPALAGASEVLLTDSMRGGEAWGTYLDAVAGPLFPALVCECNCNDGGGGGTDHVHDVTTTTGPVSPATPG